MNTTFFYIVLRLWIRIPIRSSPYCRCTCFPSKIFVALRRMLSNPYLIRPGVLQIPGIIINKKPTHPRDYPTPNQQKNDPMATAENEDLVFYPAFCFRASPTHFTWVKMASVDVHRLRKLKEFEGRHLPPTKHSITI